MPTGLIRLITTQKVLKTWSVKGMKQHYLVVIKSTLQPKLELEATGF